MQLSCPVCDTRIDSETVEITDNSFYCPNCEMDVSIEGLITSRLVSEFEDSPTRTMTVDVSQDVGIEPGSFIGKFEILESVGEGGFGNVYKARDQELNRIVALKVPKGSTAAEINAELFLREAQLAASIRDPNIVTVHEIGKDGDTSFICSDFIDGDTLKNWTKANQSSIVDCCNLMIRVAKSLQKAHDAELIHRDLKPANILMDSDGTPFITDFGLAKRIVTDEVGNVLASQKGGEGRREIVGTPAYMSPEQAIGDLSLVNKKTDLYSLGVILYELVVGKRPFNGSSASLIQDVLYHDAIEPMKANDSVPKPLSAIIRKAMAKNQRERFDSAVEFAEELQRFVNGEPTKTSPLSLTENFFYQMSKHRLLVAASVVVVLAVGITAAVSSLGAEENAAIPFVIPPASKTPMAIVTIKTIPARATVAIVPIHPVYRTPMIDEIIQPEEVTPIKLDLPPGDFIIEAYMPGMEGGGVYEARRSVKNSSAINGESIEFKPIRLPPVDPSKLSSVKGDTVDVPVIIPVNAEYLITECHAVQPFLIQPTEVTCEQYVEVMGQLPYHLRLNEAGPKSAKNKNAKTGNRFPVTLVQFNEAKEYAERIGMRLMEFEEYYLLTSKGIDPNVFAEAVRKKINCWETKEVKSDSRGIIDNAFVSKKVYGLFTNVAEMTGTTQIPEIAVESDLHAKLFDSFIVTGAPKDHFSGDEPTVENLNTRSFNYQSESDAFGTPVFGFRCVKSLKPRFIKLNQ